MANKKALVAASIKREVHKERTRSPKWPAARNRYLKAHPRCEACGCDVNVQVHHVVPYHEDPSRELDPKNFISLCATNLCHSRIGHGGAFSAYYGGVQSLAASVLNGEVSRTRAAAIAKAGRKANDGDLST